MVMQISSDVGGFVWEIIVPVYLGVADMTTGNRYHSFWDRSGEAQCGSVVVWPSLQFPIHPNEIVALRVINLGRHSNCAYATILIGRADEEKAGDRPATMHPALDAALVSTESLKDWVRRSEHGDDLGRERQLRVDAERAKVEIEVENSRLRREIDRLTRKPGR